jgi:hypothetical protein
MIQFTDEYYQKYQDESLSEEFQIALSVYTKERVICKVIRKIAICELIYEKPDLAIQYYLDEQLSCEEEGIKLPSYSEIQDLMVLKMGELTNDYPMVDEIDLIDKIQEEHFVHYLKRVKKIINGI